MENPWVEASHEWAKDNVSDYILPKDEDGISSFSSMIDTSIPPEPFIGNVEAASVIILMINPGLEWPLGFSESNDSVYHKNFPKLKEDLLKNLRQEETKFPFYILNPEHRLSGGFRYWYQRLKAFLQEKSDYETIANKLAVIEHFPYHSKKDVWADNKEYLGSQKYNFESAAKARQKGKLIVIGKGRKRWCKALAEFDPKLNDVYKKLEKDRKESTDNIITLNSERASTLSEKNLGENFGKIKNALMRWSKQ